MLIGFMGCGKSSVGRLLARDLRWPRYDTDELVAKELALSIPEIFALGEEYFREAESAALTSIGGTNPAVIVTGGGIVLRPENVRRLHELGTVIWLQATHAVLQERLARGKYRPLLDTADPAATIAALFAQRHALYQEAADLAIDTSAMSHQEVAQAIRHELRISC